MKHVKPSLPKGTRDFTPETMAKRNFIMQTIRSTFELYGFQQIETPAMENMSTLTGKYGKEGDKLLFRVLNSGDFLAKSDKGSYEDGDSDMFATSISEKGLHYDLTVPLARYVVMNRNEISFPFKRYQIQPVWRADRPQKGRYREFYQCDADVIGSDNLINEVELLLIFDNVFNDLSLEVEIELNNRKILEGLAVHYGVGERFTEFTIIIDKLEKIGTEGIAKELKKSEFPESMIDLLVKDIESGDLTGVNSLVTVQEWFKMANIDVGLTGIEELNTVIKQTHSSKVVVNVMLARGLDYYTGCIFEVKSNELEFGSLGSGGRYDDLTALFGMEGVSGVGISFGLDRIYDVMEELDRFPGKITGHADILLLPMDKNCIPAVLKAALLLRNKGIRAEIYPDIVKIKKSMKYADQRGFRYVGIIGEAEMEKNTVSLKNMVSGEQEEVTIGRVNEILHV